jgi:acetyl-CoA acyltransferase 1
MEINNRLAQLNTHFKAEPTSSFNARNVGPKHPDDVVLVSMARTAMTRAKKGPQRNTPPEIMLKVVLEDALKKGKVDPKSVQEICIGNVLQPGAGQVSSRMAQFLAGIPEDTPLYAVNRLCSSGL